MNPVVAIVAPEHAIRASAIEGMADDLRRLRMTIRNDRLPTTRDFTYNLLLHMQQKVVGLIVCNFRVTKPFLRRTGAVIGSLGVASLLAACAHVPQLPPVNCAEPGWTLRQGQAVWLPRRQATAITGDLLVAIHPQGRALVQFTKAPLPIVAAQCTATQWQIRFGPTQNKRSGRGRPPARLVWLQLPVCLSGGAPAAPWLWQKNDGQTWLLQNRVTGESLAGFLTP